MTDTQIDARQLAKLLQEVALRHGLILGAGPRAWTPLQVDFCAAGNEFSRGVLACVVEVAQMIDRSVSGGQSLGDLLLEPVGQDVERPGCGGGDD